MITFSEFEKQWSSMPNADNTYIKLSLEHPLDLRVGYHGVGEKSLVIMDPEASIKLPLGKAINVQYEKLSNGRDILEFRLMNHEYEEEYVRLCWDMISSSQNEEHATQAMIKRYSYWMRLLSAGNDSFGFSQQKGLLGELIYLDECIGSKGAEAAVSSWQGPDGGDQDFQFDIGWTEIKTVPLAGEKVRISSMQQLDQEQDGVLVVYVLEKTVAGEGRYNLVEMVNHIEGEISSEPQTLDMFEMKLYKYGYRKSDIDRYKEYYFRLVESRRFDVSSDFPRLTRSNVDDAVASCEYELSLSAIEKYRRD